MDSGSSSASELRCSIRSYRTEEEEKETAELRSSALTSPLAPHAIVSSTNSKAQAPNLNNAREAFPTSEAMHLIAACASVKTVTLSGIHRRLAARDPQGPGLGGALGIEGLMIISNVGLDTDQCYPYCHATE
jgi:hypothetical protein